MIKQRARGNVWRFSGKAYVGDALCAEAIYTAMLVRQNEMKLDSEARI